MKEKEIKKTYSFKAPESLVFSVQKKIDKENAKAKTPKERTNLSRKMTDLLYDYISR